MAAGDVDRAGHRALVVLVGLADVEDERPGFDLLGGAGRVDLGDLGLGGGEEIAEGSHELKGYQSGRDLATRSRLISAGSSSPSDSRGATASANAVHAGRLGVDDDDSCPAAPWPAARGWRPGTPTASSRRRAAHRTRSAARIAASITSGTSDWPNEIVSLLTIPTRRRGSAGRPRRRAPVRAARPSDGGRRTSSTALQRIVPWTSITLAGSCPARWCSSSTFWVTTARACPGAPARRSPGGRGSGCASHAGECKRFCHADRRTSGSAR